MKDDELKAVIEDVITVLAPFAPHCTSEYAKGWNTYRERLIAGIHQHLYPHRLDSRAVNSVMYPPTNKDTMKTGTQNREYDPETPLMVRSTLVYPNGNVYTWTFDWNDRECVRVFAADSDRALRDGAKTTLELA